jgi:hypothetical protein
VVVGCGGKKENAGCVKTKETKDCRMKKTKGESLSVLGEVRGERRSVSFIALTPASKLCGSGVCCC